MQVLDTLLQQEKSLGTFIRISRYINPDLPIKSFNLATTLEGVYGRTGRNEITMAGKDLKNLRGIYRFRINFKNENYYYYGESSSLAERMLDRVGECIHYLRYLPLQRQYKRLLSKRFNRTLTSEEAREIFKNKVFANTLDLGDFFYGKPRDAKRKLAREIAKEFRTHNHQKKFLEQNVHISYISLGEACIDKEAPDLLKYGTKLLESYAIKEHTEYSDRNSLINVKDEISSLPKRKAKYIKEYERVQCCNSDSETPILLQDHIISEMYKYSKADE